MQKTREVHIFAHSYGTSSLNQQKKKKEEKRD